MRGSGICPYCNKPLYAHSIEDIANCMSSGDHRAEEPASMIYITLSRTPNMGVRGHA
jgi:hypothetical protein